MKLRLLAAAVWTAAIAAAQISPFEYYGAERGLSSLAIEAITQDADNVLWVGTRDGLFRFNGERFELFSEQQGLPSRRVREMLIFGGRLWVATDRGVAAWDGSRFAPPPGANPLADTPVHTLAVAAGRLFIGADSGLWQLWERTMVAIGTDPVYALHAEPDGPLWAAGAKGLWRYDPTTGRGQSSGAGLPDREWRGVATSKDGIVWVRANGELWKREPDAERFTLARALVRTSDHLALYRMPDGNLMAPSLSGVLIWRDRNWEVLDEQAGLFGAWSSCVYWDHEGNLWVGLPTVGVARERGAGRWILWSSLSGLPHSTVTALTRDRDGGVWAGTPAGLAQPKYGEREWIGVREGLPQDNITALAGDARGALWIGYEYSGLARFDLASRKTTAFGTSQGIAGLRVFTLGIAADNSVWAATDRGLYRLPEGDPSRRFEPVNGVTGTVFGLAFAPDGAIWAATDAGLWRGTPDRSQKEDTPQREETWQRYDSAQGLPEDRVRFVDAAQDGSLWIGFASRGIAQIHYRDGQITQQTVPKRTAALESNDLTFVRTDPRGWVWVGTVRGIELHDGTAWRSLGYGSGLAWPDTRRGAFLLDEDGSAWIGTSGGLSLFTPPDPWPPAKAPGVWLLTTQFAAPAKAGPNRLEVPSSGRSLTVQFAPATFEHPTAAIRYRLVGARAEWSEASGRTLVFGPLRPAGYSLELAASVDGVHWTDPPVRLPFRVNPPWWRHWYVAAAVIALIVLGVRGAWAIRMRRYMALRERLEQEIAEQQRHLEQARRTAGEMDRRFRSLLENVRLATLIFDRAGKITFCNDHLVALTGWARRELIGRDWIDAFIPEEDRALMRERFRGDDLDATGGDHYECSILTARDGVRIIQWSNTLLRDGSGAITGIAGIGADMTEQRKLDEHLRQIQKMESLGRLAGGVAHDFNNLLTVINGYGDLLLRKLPAANPLRRQVEEIRKAGARAFEITQQMLIFSRKQPIEPTALSLNQVIRESESLIERVLGESVNLSLKLQPDLGSVRADAGQVCQILLNLASNARDAMPSGGTFTIESSNDGADMVRLAAIDTGAGMTEETQSHIFEPFFTSKEKGRGTGLGLATVYGIVQQGGGSIEVHSAPGEGARFDILLPRVGETSKILPRELVSIVPAPGLGRVLVAEDDSVVREFVVEVLRSQGYEVIAASNGVEAVHSAGPQVDLLVTDVVMPGMTGRELADRLRDARPAMRVLYMSGYAGDELGPGGSMEGIAFLAKPFAPEDLVRKVREAMAVDRTVN